MLKGKGAWEWISRLPLPFSLLLHTNLLRTGLLRPGALLRRSNMDGITKLPALFGSMVFNEETMKEHLSAASYNAWKKCITDGTSLDISTASIASLSEM